MIPILDSFFRVNSVMRRAAKRNRLTPHLAILVVSGATACITGRLIAVGQEQPSPMQQADQLARSGQTEEAVRLLQDALAARPADLDVRLALATVLAREHKYKEAQATIALLPAPKGANERVRYFRLVASTDSGLGDSHTRPKP
jgi:cytochrome c-type biogenesis protein CcmH/NrfG